MSENAAKPRAAGMGFIMIAVLIDMISIGLIVPVLPALVGKFTGSQADQAYWLGWITFTFAIANFFGAPILGALSDRYGRRPVLLLGFCGLALNFFATALATSMWMLIASRLIGGGMQANAAVANAYVADISAPEERAKRFGMLGAMFGLGFIAGTIPPFIVWAVGFHIFEIKPAVLMGGVAGARSHSGPTREAATGRSCTKNSRCCRNRTRAACACGR